MSAYVSKPRSVRYGHSINRRAFLNMPAGPFQRSSRIADGFKNAGLSRRATARPTHMAVRTASI